MPDFSTLSPSLKQVQSLPDKVTDLLRETILSGKWRPGARIVETRVAKELGIGQPTVREALGKLEEAGLVRRFPNSGCIVTELTERELGQMFRVRIELECLAVELAIDNKTAGSAVKLQRALRQLKKAAGQSDVQEYYRVDFQFHKTIWELADNRFLEKALSQLVVPLFNFAVLEILAHKKLDFVRDAAEHEQLVEAILSTNKAHARQTVRSVLGEFWHKGIGFVHEKPETEDLPPSNPRVRRPKANRKHHSVSAAV